MPTVCCVVSCHTGNESRQAEKLQTFPFPKDVKLRNKWLKKINRDFSSTGGQTPSHRVCSRHFLPECFVPDEENIDGRGRLRKNRRLKNQAVPTLHLRDSKPVRFQHFSKEYFVG